MLSRSSCKLNKFMFHSEKCTKITCLLVKDEELPSPNFNVSNMRSSSMLLTWYMPERPPSNYNLTHYVITLVGNQFDEDCVGSDASYECMMEYNCQKVPAIQHTWIIKKGCRENRLEINGIYNTAVYQ
jgi:hypothetical protein